MIEGEKPFKWFNIFVCAPSSPRHTVCQKRFYFFRFILLFERACVRLGIRFCCGLRIFFPFIRIYWIVVKAKQCQKQTTEIIDQPLRRAQQPTRIERPMWTFDIKMACMFYAFNNIFSYSSPAIFFFLQFFFAGLILLHISIVIMIITFINKITRWKLCDGWMNDWESRKIAKARMAAVQRHTVGRGCEAKSKPHKIFSSN